MNDASLRRTLKSSAILLSNSDAARFYFACHLPGIILLVSHYIS